MPGEKNLSAQETQETQEDQDVYTAEGEIPDEQLFKALEQVRDTELDVEDVNGILGTMASDGTVELNGKRMPFSEAAQYQAGMVSENALPQDTQEVGIVPPSEQMVIEQPEVPQTVEQFALEEPVPDTLEVPETLEQGGSEKAVSETQRISDAEAGVNEVLTQETGTEVAPEQKESIEGENLGAFFNELRAAALAGNPDAEAALKSLEAGQMPHGAYEEAFAAHLINAIDVFDTEVRNAANETEVIQALNKLYSGVPKLPVIAPSQDWMTRKQAEDAIVDYMTNRSQGMVAFAGPIKDRVEALWQEWDSANEALFQNDNSVAEPEPSAEQSETGQEDVLPGSTQVPETAQTESEPVVLGEDPGELDLNATVERPGEEETATNTTEAPVQTEPVPGENVSQEGTEAGNQEASVEDGEARIAAFDSAIDGASSIADVVRALEEVQDENGRYVSPRTLGTTVHVPTMIGYVQDKQNWAEVRKSVYDYCVRDAVDKLYGFAGDEGTRAVAKELRGEEVQEVDTAQTTEENVAASEMLQATEPSITETLLTEAEFEQKNVPDVRPDVFEVSPVHASQQEGSPITAPGLEQAQEPFPNVVPEKNIDNNAPPFVSAEGVEAREILKDPADMDPEELVSELAVFKGSDREKSIYVTLPDVGGVRKDFWVNQDRPDALASIREHVAYLKGREKEVENEEQEFRKTMTQAAIGNLRGAVKRARNLS